MDAIAIEVVVADAAALVRFAESDGFRSTSTALAGVADAVHAARVTRFVCTKDRGVPTLAGIRGVAVADVISRLSAHSQRTDEVSRLFLPAEIRNPRLACLPLMAGVNVNGN